MIEESDGDETKNQVGASPEPDVLMEHVEYDDSNNEQDVLHGGEKVSSPFGECQEKRYGTTKKHIGHKSEKENGAFRSIQNIFVPFVPLCGSTMADGFGA